MSKAIEPIFSQLQFYTTASYKCSYIDGRIARSQVATPANLVNGQVYSRLVEQGFRRSGAFTYRPACASCQACIPLRVDAGNFQRNRTQQRLWRRMQAQLKVRLSPLHWSAQHYELYQRYQRQRHPGAGMDNDDPKQYAEFLLHSQVKSKMAIFNDGDGQVQIVAIMDMLDNGISAVYTFYNPDCRAGLGTYAILWQIEYCRNYRLPWLYLGYWVEENRKMAYKSQFQPNQILLDGVWC